jgi:hypothetical protein
VLINLTPHDLDIVTDSTTMVIPSSGCARVVFEPDEPAGSVVLDGTRIPVFVTASTGTVTGLPEPRAGVTYVVSRQVYDVCPERQDLVITHRAVRDGDRIVGCRAFARPVRLTLWRE